MGKAKQPAESRTSSTSGRSQRKSAKPRAAGKARKTAIPKKGTRLSGEEPQPRATIGPLNDTELGEVAEMADEARIREVTADLNPADREAFGRVRRSLAEHLGSDAAARVWLVTPGTGFETTALDAICKGQVGLVLATLEAQWGPSPIYA